MILLDTYYYSPDGKTNKKPPSELSKDIHDFVERLQGQYDRYGYRFTMDSAEGALRNQYYNDYALWWHPVNKSKKSTMIDHMQSLLGQGRFFYLDLDSNKIFVEEHKTYQWDEKTIQSDDPKVIKVDDHTCDQFQYFVMDNLRDLGLKW
ncbi:phage terminase large subunit [Melissococcus plutonius]|nr:phage terminase large subunit [Melissococcus plutonius]KMT38979.1 phage terminase, large subunit [Melissococcus plutonius]BBD15612.1 phage terminase, large subunit [Melissococcus plutonius]